MMTRNCVSLLVAVFVLSHSALAQSTYNQFPVDSIIPNTITVTAEGTAEAEPDVAKFEFDVESTSSKISRARIYNEEKVSKVMDYLIKAGIERDDIKTVNFTIGPYTGTFRALQRLRVTLRDISRIDDVLEGLGKSGTTNLTGVSYDVGDIEVLKTKAYEKAIHLSIERSKVLADAAGSDVDSVVTIKEIYVPTYYPSYYGYGGVVQSMSAGGMAFGGSTAQTNQPTSLIQPETYKVTVRVLVIYSIKPKAKSQ